LEKEKTTTLGAGSSELKRPVGPSTLHDTWDQKNIPPHILIPAVVSSSMTDDKKLEDSLVPQASESLVVWKETSIPEADINNSIPPSIQTKSEIDWVRSDAPIETNMATISSRLDSVPDEGGGSARSDDEEGVLRKVYGNEEGRSESSLSVDARRVVDSLPDLSFLSARKLLYAANDNLCRFQTARQ